MKIFGKYCVQILFAHNFVQRCYRQVRQLEDGFRPKIWWRA